MNKGEQTPIKTLAELLTHGQTGTQTELCDALQQKGFLVTQSTISRLLHKLGAVKIKGTKGQSTYRIPHDRPPTRLIEPLSNLILSITHNNHLIVIRTHPGSAPLIAHVLDTYQPANTLGSIAGDDTIFIAPENLATIDNTLAQIEDFLTN
ncbi:MAG: ArgR family transcriptional regulator [Gammaproteobacteria bacterium]|nr:ArgR family transcriptional regulator [Gammaproteobacteria bacterium]